MPPTKGDAGYRVTWGPTVVHPDLTPGATFDRTRTWAPRAAILDAAGQALSAPVVNIGVRPSGVTDRARVIKALADTVQIDAATVNAALDKPGIDPSATIVLKTIPRTAFAPVQAALEPIPGIFFPRSATDSGGSVPESLAAYVIGATRAATPEDVTELGAPYQLGDIVGASGLERSQQKTLAGTPTIEIRLVGPPGVPAGPRVVHTVPGGAPAPVATTIDRALQRAAEDVLRTKNAAAALVAVDGKGGIRAMASWAPSAGFNRATAFYAPGSTFKVVTAEGLVAGGLTPESMLACPPSITAAGTTIRNFEGEQKAQLPFTEAFAISCNTAFIGATQTIPADLIRDAAKRNGFDVPYDIGIATRATDGVGGRFTDEGDGAVKTSMAIGQGKVEATPLHMASVAATVMTGQWQAPSFLATRPATLPTATPLDPNVKAALTTFMRGVVERPDGTGTDAAAPPKTVAGKTGTAEFGTKNPPDTHAWFISFAGDLAVSVLVENGGVGGEVAAPLAGQFYRSVP